MFFLLTGDRRRALETQDYDDAAWLAALRFCLRGSKRGPAENSPWITRVWTSAAGRPETAIGVDWIGEALTELDTEQRACVVIPALFGTGDERLADFLGCSPAQASARRLPAMDRLWARLAEADLDRHTACPPSMTEADLATALAEAADRCLNETFRSPPVQTVDRWISRAVMLIIAALVLGPGLAGLSLRPQGASWQDSGAIVFFDGHLRQIGRGSVTQAQWSPDGARIVLAATTGVYAVDAATLRPLAYAPTEPGTRLLGFNQDGTQFATWLDGALALRDAIDLRPVFTAASAAWRDATATAWDGGHERLALGDSHGVALIQPRGPTRETWVPLASEAAHLRFSPDGALLAITTATPETMIFQIDGARMFEIGGSASPPRAPVFSGDGLRLIGVTGNGLGVTEFERGLWKAAFDRSGLASELWVSADGKRAVVVAAAASAEEAELLTIDLDTGGLMRRLGVPRDRQVDAFAVREDGARALVANADGLSIWDLNTGALVAASVDFGPPRRANLPTPVRFSDDGRYLVAPDAYGGLRILDATSGRTTRVINDNPDPFVDAIVSPDGETIVADNNTGIGLRPLAPGERIRQHEPALYVFDTGSGRTTHIIPGARQPQFIAPSMVAYVPIERSELRTYDFSTGANQAWAGVRAERPDAFVASVGATRLGVLTDRALELWDPAAGLMWRTPLAWTGIDRGLLGRPLAMSGDARLIAIAEPSLGIRVYAGDTGILRGTLARPITVTFDASLENPLKVAISADGRWIATVDNRPTPVNIPSSTLTVWRADTLRAIETRENFAERITGMAFSPDNRRLAIMRADFVIELIELP